MNLEQIAQQAMDYLDSVGVAAEWEIVFIYGFLETLYVHTDKTTFNSRGDKDALELIKLIKLTHPQKSPN